MSRSPHLPDDAVPPGLVRQRVQRTPQDGAAVAELVAADDWLADEVPVAMVFNGISHAVMMASPLELEDFALGFALSEGIVASADELRDVEARPAACQTPGSPPAWEVHIELSPRRLEGLKLRRRTLAGRTGCGVCGIESLQALELLPAALPAAEWLGRVDAALLARVMPRLPAFQPLNAQAGAVHVAAWADLDGEVRWAREDVGRHNALDKLIGVLARQGQLGAPGLVLMSSRASHELVAKCARVGLRALATVSAPTALGVQAAQAAGVRLWGLCRPPRAVLYTPGG
ncbi:formate dehydrogenase accessory sulfurtransferase FdhD [Ideonella dechloratans]|uniref:Sulfur carrier protein FdhD n=1 Tax=Ideonella dechloratans TaxID=36863 RepID=A0A643FEU5_IDEDE|nr:formate dehydrogenase accessory sulfurtransferase FdhD [Ideonella dechloratans]KAB0583764.1 formate dehydrogenase accessory sulfurtransferase FdhD [Ideonella dechloratans]UFU08959.1 formate dehydrogenase accessory sulfurtransferase FdhD [Ideonella dechloratans]